ncbi:MAG: EAL domain-containing protein [Pseudomonadota bacterium]
MQSVRSRSSLHLLLTAPFIAIVSVAVAVVGGLLLDAGRRSVDSLSADLWRSVAGEVTHYLDEFLAKPERITQDVAHVISGGLIDPEAREALLSYLAYPMQQDPALYVSGVGRIDGWVTAASRDDRGDRIVAQLTEADTPEQLTTRALGPEAQLGVAERSDPYDLRSRPWFQLGLASDGTAWTDPYRNYATGALLLSAVHPIVDSASGHVEGVVSSAISLEALSDFLSTIEAAQEGVVFVTDGTGQVLASSRPEEVDGESLAAMTLTALDGAVDRIAKATTQRLAIQGDTHLVHVAPFRDGNGLDWRVITSVPEAVYLGPIRASWRLSLALAVGAVLMALLAGTVVSRRIVGPLARLSEAARQVATGAVASQDVDLGDPGRAGSREVAQLHLALEQMTARLRDTFSQLEHLNAALANSEHQLRETLEMLPVGAMLHDANSRLVFVNAAASELLGLPAMEGDESWSQAALTAHTREVLKRVEAATIGPALTGEAAHVDCIELTRDGEDLAVELWSSPIYDDEGRVIFAVSALQDVGDRRRAEARLIHHATHDSLTGLANRSQLITRTNLAISRVRRTPERRFAVLFLDLDGFKVINDSLGHLIGDEVLIEVARRLSVLSRETDLAARLGGDEFVLLLEDLPTQEQALQVADRVFTALNNPVTAGGQEVRVGTSIGLVHGDELYEEASEMLRDADIALYQAKADGRGRYAEFDASMRDRAMRRQRLEEDLRDALRSENLALHFQPIVDLRSGVVTSFEALCRWQHPTLGSISPMEFVALAEETGLIVALDRWVIRSACRTIAHWRQQHPDVSFPRVAVNLSNHDVSRNDLVTYIDETLQTFKLPATALGVELTESGLVKDIEHTRETLQLLRDRGITISIDDFGTGYSSLSYLYRLPVDALKIDRSLVSGLTPGATNHKIVSSVVALSNELGIDAVAEGIEEEHELTLLRDMGCERAQGYYFARPVPASAVPALLTGEGSTRADAMITSDG